MSDIAIRPALPEDVCPALALAHRMCSGGVSPENYISGQWRMFVACDGADIVGMVCEREGVHISRLCVEPAYRCRGIAIRLMDAIIAAMAVPRVTLNSSPEAVPFYLKYGCVPLDGEQRRMEYVTPVVIRPAQPEEIPPALDLAKRIFQEFIHPGENTAANYDTEHETMFVAAAGTRVVGMASQRDGCHIRKLYVEGAWHRQGIATRLLGAIIQSMGAERVTVNSSPYAMPFYLNYGFMPTGEEIQADGFVFTPMTYECTK